MNFSIDDTSPNFVWSSGADDWKGQAPNQVAINSNYFLSTYHATQSKGSNVAITFVGAAIQLYGSKGPNHGNYSVTYDSAIKFFAGFSAQTQYQQLLFSRTFGTNYSETHTVILKNEEDYWLDLDFAVLSIAANVDTSTSDIGFFTNTVQPGTAVPPSATNSPDGSSSSSDSSSSAPSIFRTLTFVLAAVVGVLVLAILAWYLLCIRRRGGSLTNSKGGRDRKLSTSSSQQEFRYAQKNAPLAAGAGERGLDTGRTLGGSTLSPGSGSESYGRRGNGHEDYARSPTSGSTATDPSRYSRLDANAHLNSGHGGNHVGGAARETLIALNNMGGKRPGYRSLAGGEGGDMTGPGSSTASIINIGHNSDGRETPTSMRTMGSAGQVWLGATRGNNNGTEENARFKGRASRIGGGNARTSSYGSDSNLSSRLNRSRGTMSGLEDINDAKEEEGGSYRPNGVGLGVYAANIRSESEQQRMMDLKRSASVASSGILDRLERSPPPAVPELPPSATTSTSTFSRAPPPKPPPRSFSPTPTEASTVLEHGGVYSGLGLATKVQFPYGRNNEMLVHSHSGSLNSTSGLSASTTAAVHNNNNPHNSTTGSLPLRPPPVRADERERERAQLRERERAEKEREAAAEREKLRKSRYSRPPPEYVPTPNASQVSMPIHSSLHLSNTTTTTTTQGSGNGANLQRNGTRTGDIPIGIEQGYGNGYESESQDSHSVAHAYVNTAQHVAISPAQAQQNVFQQHHQSITSQPPQRPGQHVHKTSNGSSNLGLPNSAITGTSSKRAVTPDRAYNPAGSMAVAGRSSGKDTGVPAWVGRTSEEKTWGLDGAHGGDKMRSAANATSALGRPIMDDRTRLAATAPGGNAGQPTRRVSRVPPPKA